MTAHSTQDQRPVLVTGGTGKQGGAAARALLAAGVPVHALVRSPDTGGARDLQRQGAQLVQGDLDDPASIVAAVQGVRAVFSVQLPDLTDLNSDGERRRGRTLVEAAHTAGVPQFVHTSVQGAGSFHRQAPGWAEGRWSTQFWESKAYIDELARSAGFPSWTVLKPATFMENLIGWSFLFGNWGKDGFVTALNPSTRLPLIAVRDIGAAAAAALTDPQRFNGMDIELAGDELTLDEMAKVLSGILHRPVPVHTLSPAEAVAQGMHPMMVSNYEFMNEVGSPAHPQEARSLGLPTTGFQQWAEQHVQDLTPA